MNRAEYTKQKHEELKRKMLKVPSNMELTCQVLLNQIVIMQALCNGRFKLPKQTLNNLNVRIANTADVLNSLKT